MYEFKLQEYNYRVNTEYKSQTQFQWNVINDVKVACSNHVRVTNLWGRLLDAELVRVTLRLTVSQSVCLGVESTLWTFGQILRPFQVFGSEICCPVVVGRPL
jgi:hypothetical protein